MSNALCKTDMGQIKHIIGPEPDETDRFLVDFCQNYGYTTEQTTQILLDFRKKGGHEA